jgi:Protein of unknown function (DUF3325)
MSTLWLCAAALACLAGMGWLALSMDTHWQQVRAGQALPRATAWLLRALGCAALAGALVSCLRADHASMAVLVWILALAASALCVALTLSWFPRCLVPWVFWLRR